MSLEHLVIGNEVRFNLYGEYEGAVEHHGKVVGLVSGDGLILTDAALTGHTNLYPLLPEEKKKSTPDDFRGYSYVQLVLKDGAVKFLGIPWIRENSVAKIVARRRKIILDNYTDLNDDKLRAFIAQAGYEVSEIGDP